MQRITRRSKRIIRKRILISLFLIIFIRFGSFLPLPTVDQKAINFYIQTSSIPQTIIRTLCTNGPFLLNLFTLNIFPYINATILVQFLISYYPSLSRLQKEGSLRSRRKITRGTRLLTFLWAILQGSGISFYFYQISQAQNSRWDFLLSLKISIWLTTGAMIVLWLSDLITDYGLGNGTSLLVCTNIISNFPNIYSRLIHGEFKNLTSLSRLNFTLLFFLMIMLVIFLQSGETKINITSATQLNKSSSKYQGKTEKFFYIPLRLNQSGVMPIIFTTTILTLPTNIIETFHFIPLEILYWIIYFTILLQFSFFYSNISLNPKDISKQLQKMTSIIPGIRPGVCTTFYFANILKRLNIIGTLILFILSIFPKIIGLLFNVNDLTGLSAISFIIVIGVLVESSIEISDIMSTNSYSSNDS